MFGVNVIKRILGVQKKKRQGMFLLAEIYQGKMLLHGTGLPPVVLNNYLKRPEVIRQMCV